MNDKNYENNSDMLHVLYVEPYKVPQEIDIPRGLKSLQEIVDGYIQLTYPFEDEVAIICNDEGKLLSMPLNRALYDSDGQIYDIVAGPFIMAYAPSDSEDLQSMPDELMEKYKQHFHCPEEFFMTDSGIQAIKIVEFDENFLEDFGR